ncbi:methyl-accepting chemotaxis protein [Paenibacillus sp. SYP-B4298]|uniref:methyl-accepting chemotaxis protein n=1 Tax=Paenibacillus sp. SYP-B4298 TaxID=2996034 RepID=UPI0022DD338B|nr:methyl-accepting chemotaxis protein [Paenibacillus sp. SYP-B4298]
MRWIYNLRTSVKLISSFLLVSMLMAMVGIYSMSNLGKMNASLANMYDNALIPIQSSMSTQISYTRLRVLARDNFITTSQAQLQENIKSIENERKIMIQGMDTFRKTKLTEATQEILRPFDAIMEQYFALYDQSIQSALDGDKDALKALIEGGLGTTGNQMRDLLTRLVEQQVLEAEQAKQEGQSLYESSRNITIAVLVASVIIAIALGYFISQIISRPLQRVSQLAASVAQGDLRQTIGITSKDEVGQLAQAMDEMVHNLQHTVGSILNHSQSLAAASQEISASTEEIASGNASQASDAQTISELFKELSGTIHEIAANTEQASQLSDETVKIAQQGNSIIQSSSDSMQAMSAQMTRLEDDSQKVGEIIGVIEDIADQTNLLALNAAIEAARAGEQGRGFAVVADEVRKLAERSGEATKQITGIIKGMQENTKSSVRAVQDSAGLSAQSGDAFQNIVAYINEAGQKVMEIAAASEEQAAQTTTVLAAVENISATTEEAAASSQQTAATAQALAHLAQELQQSVSIFKLD